MALREALEEAMERAKQYQTCMSLMVSEEGRRVSLILDTGRDYYSEWIPGEGGDIGLLRDQETNKVVGVDLPLLNPRLAVFYEGPLRVNAGFRKEGP